MDLTPIVAALRQRCPSFAQRVAGAAEYEAASASTALAVPHAFVIPLDDSPTDSQSENVNRQSLVDAFAVVVVASVAGMTDERGQAAMAVVHNLRRELWAALLGWEPAAGYEGITYQGGSLQSIDRSRIWYQFEFGAETEIGPEDGWQGDVSALPDLQEMSIEVDVIDPIADPSVSFPGPDGRIEQAVVLTNLHQE